MNIIENVLIKDHTTFKTGGPALFFIEVRNIQELIEAIIFSKKKKLPFTILGGGSNILAKDGVYNGVIIKMQIKGITFEKSGEREEGIRGEGQNQATGATSVFVTASAGEVWDDFVELTVSKGLRGLENLSLIPGTVGASPIQNIGAYGSEVGDRISWVEALDTDSNLENPEIKRFSNVECDFSYRNSFFKTPEGRKYVILRVCFRLEEISDNSSSEKEQSRPQSQFEKDKMYKDLKEYFQNKKMQDTDIRLSDIRNAVIEIRKNKLPDWHVLGTAGSFFKNPIILETEYQNLLRKYPELPAYSLHTPEKTVKIPLGWVLDKICGLKGYKEGKVSTYRDQALVIVSEGASEKEINDFADRIASIVKEKTGIVIEREVNSL